MNFKAFSLLCGFASVCIRKMRGEQFQVFYRGQFGAGGTKYMRFLHMRVGFLRLFHMFQKLGSRKQASAYLASLKRMASDSLIPDKYGSHISPIFKPDGAGRADIGAGSASEASSHFRRNHTIHSVFFNYSKGLCSDNIFTNPDAQTATNATIGFCARGKPEFFANLMDDIGPGRQFQKIANGSISQLINHCTLCGYFQSLPAFDCA
jgi:hypothetical protein